MFVLRNSAGTLYFLFLFRSSSPNSFLLSIDLFSPSLYSISGKLETCLLSDRWKFSCRLNESRELWEFLWLLHVLGRVHPFAVFQHVSLFIPLWIPNGNTDPPMA